MGIFSYRFSKRETSFFSANKIVLPYNLKCAFLVSNVLKACDEYQLQMLADFIVLISEILSPIFSLNVGCADLTRKMRGRI